MSLLDTLKKSLTPELFTSVQEALGDDFDFDMVPRSRLNTVIKQRNQARKELNELLDNEPEGGSGAGGDPDKKFTQADLDAAVQAEKDKNAEVVAGLHKRYAVTGKLREAKVVDPDLVLKAGLVDLEKITLDENGTVTGGLDDQIANLTETKAYLFGSAGGARGTGKTGGTDDFGAITSKEEFLKLPVDKQIEFKAANPEVFKGFMQA